MGRLLPFSWDTGARKRKIHEAGRSAAPLSVGYGCPIHAKINPRRSPSIQVPSRSPSRRDCYKMGNEVIARHEREKKKETKERECTYNATVSAECPCDVRNRYLGSAALIESIVQLQTRSVGWRRDKWCSTLKYCTCNRPEARRRRAGQVALPHRKLRNMFQYAHKQRVFLDFFLHLVGHPGKIPSMGLSKEQYEALKTASIRFLTEKNYGFSETESVMATVFCDDRSSIEAKAWTTYWSVLSTAGESMDQNEAYTVPPIPLLDGSMPDVEMAEDNSNASGSQPTLSNGLLHSDATDRQREREEQKRNGNQHGREKNPLGCGFDELMASAFIERSVINSVKQMKPMYYCIGCDLAVRNNNRKRNMSHMLGCKKLQRDFPSTWSKFKDDVPASGSQVASGEADAPVLRVKKRKLEDPSLGRVPIPGITTELASELDASTKAPPAQVTLDDTWGASKITATRQSIINYLLLRLIVCCALAFSLCDNGFFIDFCNAMCPSYSVPDRSNFITYNLVVEAENAMVQLTTFWGCLGQPLGRGPRPTSATPLARPSRSSPPEASRIYGLIWPCHATSVDLSHSPTHRQTQNCSTPTLTWLWEGRPMVPGMLEGRWDRDQGSPNLAEVASANLGQPQPTSANFPSTNPVEPPRPTSANLGRPRSKAISKGLYGRVPSVRRVTAVNTVQLPPQLEGVRELYAPPAALP
ncbi:hypothetical protein C8R44DRAFT_736839 [Mycena epipterygia]|nr:hypothetical protein C8R44DRAFT_736839 [Mycena epipterygia]